MGTIYLPGFHGFHAGSAVEPPPSAGGRHFRTHVPTPFSSTRSNPTQSNSTPYSSVDNHLLFYLSFQSPIRPRPRARSLHEARISARLDQVYRWNCLINRLCKPHTYQSDTIMLSSIHLIVVYWTDLLDAKDAEIT